MAALENPDRLRHRFASLQSHHRAGGRDRRRNHALRHACGGGVNHEPGIFLGGVEPCASRLVSKKYSGGPFHQGGLGGARTAEGSRRPFLVRLVSSLLNADSLLSKNLRQNPFHMCETQKPGSNVFATVKLSAVIICRIHSLFLFFRFFDSLATIASSSKKGFGF